MDPLSSILEAIGRLLGGGDLEPSARVLGALGPAVALMAYLAVASLVYQLSRASRRYGDPEAASRKTGLTTPGMRVFFSWLMRPWIRLLLRAELPPNAITTVSFGISLAAGVALAAGRFSLGGWLYAAAGACDFFDGRIARAQGRAAPQGAALDSIVDRYSESAVLIGLAWYYRETWVLVPTLLALTGSLLVPYVRAKAEALSVPLQEVGWLQRPERVALLAGATALAPLLEVVIDPLNPRPFHGLAVVGLLILGIGTQVTAAQRTRRLLVLLDPRAAEAPARGARAIASSVLATASDATLVALLSLSLAPGSLPLATAAGCLMGALINFTLNRSWAFRAGEGPLGEQVRRYALTSVTSALLNAGGVAVVGLLPNVPGALAWLLVRGTVFGVWTLPLYRSYVFSTEEAPPLLELPSSPRSTSIEP